MIPDLERFLTRARKNGCGWCGGTAEIPHYPDCELVATIDAAWIARGEADKVAVADQLRTLMGAEAARPYVSHLERAIDGADKH